MSLKAWLVTVEWLFSALIKCFRILFAFKNGLLHGGQKINSEFQSNLCKTNLFTLFSNFTKHVYNVLFKILFSSHPNVVVRSFYKTMQCSYSSSHAIATMNLAAGLHVRHNYLQYGEYCAKHIIRLLGHSLWAFSAVNRQIYCHHPLKSLNLVCRHTVHASPWPCK